MLCKLIAFLFIVLHFPVGFYSVETKTGMDYSSSTIDLKNLIRHEQKVLKVLTSYAEKLQTNAKAVEEYLEDFHLSELQGPGLKSLITIGNVSLLDGDVLADEVVKHPLMSYRVIKRLAINLPSIENSLDELRYEEFDLKQRLKNLRQELALPNSDDFKTSISGVIKLKQIYQVGIDEIVKGTLNDLETQSGLMIKDCYEIGLYAYEKKWYTQAIDFLEKALTMSETESAAFSPLELKEIDEKLSAMILEHDEKLENGLNETDFQSDCLPFFFNRILHNRTHNSFKIRKPAKLNPKKYYANDDPMAIVSKYEHLCRGEDLRPASVKSRLYCYLDSSKHPTWIIGPLKVEVHNENPLVVQIYNVLNNIETLKLQEEVQYKLKRSGTISIDKRFPGITSSYRVSSNAWITDMESQEFKYINSRVGRMTGLELTKWYSSEGLQIANYPPGGHYAPHTDATHEEVLLHTYDEVEFLSGDRIATFMIYLSDVERGGRTVFPRLGVGVNPVKGSAVFWFNLYSNGSINRDTLHGACPVLYGIKWVANKWIRSNAQTFLKRCPRDVEEQNYKF